MTAEHSTYTYETGEQETVTLKRGPATPHGHAVLKVEYSDGQVVDCYVNTAWLRDRLNDLDPRPLTPDAITDEMVERVWQVWCKLPPRDMHSLRIALTAALTEPPARPEGAEDIEAALGTWKGSRLLDAGLFAEDRRDLANHIAEEMNR